MNIVTMNGKWWEFPKYKHAITFNKSDPNSWKTYEAMNKLCNRLYGISCAEIGKQNPKWDRDIKQKRYQFYFSDKKYLDLVLLGTDII